MNPAAAKSSLSHMAGVLGCLALAAFVLAACDSGGEDSAPTAVESSAVPSVTETPGPAATPDDGLERVPLTIVTAGGDSIQLQAEVADSPEERTQGLMGRMELAPDSGMFFVLDPPGRGFWMRGTPLPLTVAFIGVCGEIVDFADLEPLSEEIRNTDQPYSFALEMARGWFSDQGIAAGDTLELPSEWRSAEC
jgi:uncharacterized membrane protein (UPF0127 family)